ncbi:MAG: hypothetical protein ACFFDI_03100 [Promethearchaeota archaeon]
MQNSILEPEDFSKTWDMISIGIYLLFRGVDLVLMIDRVTFQLKNLYDGMIRMLANFSLFVKDVELKPIDLEQSSV